MTIASGWRPRNFNPNSNAGGHRPSSNICDDKTQADSFVIKIRQLINTLETNGSYTEILNKHVHAIAYIESSSTEVLISSNCTEYFNGLNAARKLDTKAEEQQAELEDNANRLFSKILQSFRIRNFFDDFF